MSKACWEYWPACNPSSLFHMCAYLHICTKGILRDRTHIRIQSLFLFHLYHNYIQRLTVLIIKTFKIFCSYVCMCACVWVSGEGRRGCHSWSWSYRGCKSALHAGTNSGPLQKQCHLTSPQKMVIYHYSVPVFQCNPPHGVRCSVLCLMMTVRTFQALRCLDFGF